MTGLEAKLAETLDAFLRASAFCYVVITMGRSFYIVVSARSGRKMLKM